MVARAGPSRHQDRCFMPGDCHSRIPHQAKKSNSLLPSQLIWKRAWSSSEAKTRDRLPVHMGVTGPRPDRRPSPTVENQTGLRVPPSRDLEPAKFTASR